ncbi:MAG: cyanophycin synthetase, partial [Chlamydiota bacterium]
GNRDTTKRPKMGKVAADLADKVYITSDNPRDEEPESIISQILAGIADKSHVCVEVDRRQAIAAAIKEAGPADMVLIAGKGHETYQIFSHRTIEFDDAQVAKESIDEKFL